MLAQGRMRRARLMRRCYTHQVHTGDGFGITRDGQAAKPQTFRTGDGWFAYNPLRQPGPGPRVKGRVIEGSYQERMAQDLL